MIYNAEIRGFKGINTCEIRDFCSINLLIGRNNSCKSTILEALYSTIKEFTGAHLGEVLRRKTNVTISPRELWYNYLTQNPIKVYVDFSPHQHLGMEISFQEKTNAVSTHLHAIEGIEEKRQFMAGAIYSDLVTRTVSYGGDFFSRLTSGNSEEARNFAENSLFIDSTQRNDIKSMENLLGEIKLGGKSDEVGHYLESIFGTGLSWEFLPMREAEEEFRAAINQNGKYLFLYGLGDGFRYGLQVIGKTIMSNKTAIFIEEIESHQHPGSLKKIIPFLVETSKKNNLQLFITTHSYYVWRLFETEFFEKPDDRQEFFCPYLIERNEATGEVTATPQTKENADEFYDAVEKSLSQ